jgi:hypothetical protein
LLLIKPHITYMNISRYANIDKFVNIRYIFLLARRAYSWLFQLAQMWKLPAPGVGLGDLLTPDSIQHYVIKFASDLRQVGGFLRVIRFPQPIKLTATI